MREKSKGFIILFVGLLMSSCDSNAVFDSYVSFPNKWHKDSIVSFSFEAPDTIENYNLYVNLRNNNDYKFNNLYIITELNYPNGRTVRDTLEYKMAKPNGELLGTGFTDIKENKLWLKGYEDVFQFNEQGEYQINIQHAMRQNGDINGLVDLVGVTEVGFRIESIQ